MKLFLIGLVLLLATVGGVELLPPTAGILSWMQIIASFVIAVLIMLAGLSDIK